MGAKLLRIGSAERPLPEPPGRPGYGQLRRQRQLKPGHCYRLTCWQGVTGSAQSAKSVRRPGHGAIRTRPPCRVRRAWAWWKPP